ncbi:MAG: PAS domain S-box protein [Methylococcaceae bacterium]|nr:PAS domain S-box protein [Methylococcaceae bacterium]
MQKVVCNDIYHAIFNHLLEGIIGIDEAGMICVINPAAEKMFGYKKSEIFGKSISILMPEPHDRFHDTYVQRYCHSGQSVVGNGIRQVEGLHKNKTIIPLEIVLTEVQENNKRLFLGSLRDVSLEAKQYKQLKKIKQDLQHSQEYAGIGYWHLDLVTKNLEYSNNFKNIYGLNEQSELSSYKDLIGNVYYEDKQALFTAISSYLKGENQNYFDEEYRVVCEDGSFKWVQAKGEIEHKDDKPVFLHGIIQDISSRKASEAKETSLGRILNKANIEIYIFDVVTLKFVEVNELAKENLGYSLAELKEMSPLIIKSELNQRQFSEIIRPLLENKQKKINFQSKHYRKDGTAYPVEVLLQKMNYNNREVFVAFVEDMTEREKVIKKLYEASQAKSLFLSRMSHELRTPLNAILGFSQLMQLDDDEPLGEEQADSLGEIYKAGEHLLDLINEILEISRIEAGKYNLNLEKIDLTQIAADTHKLAQPIAASYGITLINELKESPYVYADGKLIKQILLNLITNAIKYNKKDGSVRFNIIVADESYDSLRIEVNDTGIGLSTEQLKKAFQPFERLGAETTDIEGTGVGLTLCKELVELMKGEIGVESCVNEGSCFWFSLPIFKETTTEKLQTLEEPIKPSLKRNKNVAATILYIEDNIANAKLVEYTLKKLNYKFLLASDIKTGFEIAQAYLPDLILIDINLPKINGLEGKKLFDAHPKLNKIPTLAISASAMAHDKEAALKAGYSEFIGKPINLVKLQERINAYL